MWKVPAGVGSQIRGGLYAAPAERPDAYQAKPTAKAVMARVPPPSGGMRVVERGGSAGECHLLEIAKGLI